MSSYDINAELADVPNPDTATPRTEYAKPTLFPAVIRWKEGEEPEEGKNAGTGDKKRYVRTAIVLNKHGVEAEAKVLGTRKQWDLATGNIEGTVKDRKVYWAPEVLSYGSDAGDFV